MIEIKWTKINENWDVYTYFILTYFGFQIFFTESQANRDKIQSSFRLFICWG